MQAIKRNIKNYIEFMYVAMVTMGSISAISAPFSGAATPSDISLKDHHIRLAICPIWY
jgi:hypothetical protein